VYEGTNGEFVLYEDGNTNYDYEKGAFATIRFTWDDENKQLIIGKRRGEFENMLQNRTFKVMFISGNLQKGYSSYPEPFKTVLYNGGEVVVTP
jgi:alpha-D-xyloside xylohydrolase